MCRILEKRGPLKELNNAFDVRNSKTPGENMSVLNNVCFPPEAVLKFSKGIQCRCENMTIEKNYLCPILTHET